MEVYQVRLAHWMPLLIRLGLHLSAHRGTHLATLQGWEAGLYIR